MAKAAALEWSHGTLEKAAELDDLPVDCDPPTLRAPILHDDDEVWRIDSSGVGCTWDEQPTTDALSYYQLDRYQLNGRRDWRRTPAQSFDEAGRDPKATVFVLHGNRTSLAEATQMVLDVYRHVSQANERPLRMVLWTWPSRRTFNRPRRDIRLKAERSEVTGRQLAGVLRRIDPHAPVGLVGFSFGARAITKALHLLGEESGQEANRAVAVSLQQGRPAPIRALLIAAALDNDALLPSGPHPLALSQVDRMIVTNNRCDWLLKAYRHLYCWRGPDALGLMGLAADDVAGGPLEKIEYLDVTNSVGKFHIWPYYIQAPEITAALRSDLIGP